MIYGEPQQKTESEQLLLVFAHSMVVVFPTNQLILMPELNISGR
jgi:hypothetical protein